MAPHAALLLAVSVAAALLAGSTAPASAVECPALPPSAFGSAAIEITTSAEQGAIANDGGNPSNLAVSNNSIYFAMYAEEMGRELWKVDAGSDRAALVKEWWTTSNIHGTPDAGYPSYLVHDEASGNIYFTAKTSIASNNRYLHRVDAATGAVYAMSTNVIITGGLTIIDDKLYASGMSNEAYGYEPFVMTLPTGGLGMRQVNTYSGGNVGSRSSNPSFFTKFKGLVYFSASTRNEGYELWRFTTNASNSVEIVEDFIPSTGWFYPTNFRVLGPDLMVLTGTDPAGVVSLYSSDGEAGGFVRIGINSTAASPSPYMQAVGGGLAWGSADDGVHGVELWVTDGTAAGTRMLADINPSADASSPGSFLWYEGRMYFSAIGAGIGRELYSSDGVSVELVQDLLEGSSSSSPSSLSLAPPSEGGFVFSATVLPAIGNELYHYDVGANVTLRADANRYTYGAAAIMGGSNAFTAVGDRLFFAAGGGSSAGEELFVADESGKITMIDVYPGATGSEPDAIVDLNGVALFAANSGSGIELHRSEGTAATTWQVKDMWTGGDGFAGAGNMVVLGSFAFFKCRIATFDGFRLCSSNGTAAGTQVISSALKRNVGNQFQHMTAFGDGILFQAFGDTYGDSLWRTSLSTGTTVNVGGQTRPSRIEVVQALDGGADIGLVAAIQALQRGLHVVNTADNTLTALATVATTVVTPAFPTAMIGFLGRGYFNWITDLGVTDGTPGGTELVPGGEGTYPRSFAVADGALYYIGVMDSLYLSTDGACVTLVRNLAGSSVLASNLVAFGDTVYFSHGSKLYRSTNGTSAGVEMLRDASQGVDLLTNTYDGIHAIAAVGTSAVYVGANDFYGSNLWRLAAAVDECDASAAPPPVAFAEAASGVSAETGALEMAWDVGVQYYAGSFRARFDGVPEGSPCYDAQYWPAEPAADDDPQAGACLDRYTASWPSAAFALAECGFDGPFAAPAVLSDGGAGYYYETTAVSTAVRPAGAVFGAGQNRTDTSAQTLRVVYAGSASANVSAVAYAAFANLTAGDAPLAAVTRQEYNFTESTATFTMRTSAAWPYVLELDQSGGGGGGGSALGGDTLKFELEAVAKTGVAACDAAAGGGGGSGGEPLCEQEWLLRVTARPGQCDLTGDFTVSFSVRCSLAFGSGDGCPGLESDSALASFSVETDSICARVVEVASLTQSMELFDSAAGRDLAAGRTPTANHIQGGTVFGRIDVAAEAGAVVASTRLLRLDIAGACVSCGGAGLVTPLVGGEPVAAVAAAIGFEYDAGALAATPHTFQFQLSLASVAFSGNATTGTTSATVSAVLEVVYEAAAGKKLAQLSAAGAGAVGRAAAPASRDAAERRRVSWRVSPASGRDGGGDSAAVAVQSARFSVSGNGATDVDGGSAGPSSSSAGASSGQLPAPGWALAAGGAALAVAGLVAAAVAGARRHGRQRRRRGRGTNFVSSSAGAAKARHAGQRRAGTASSSSLELAAAVDSTELSSVQMAYEVVDVTFTA